MQQSTYDVLMIDYERNGFKRYGVPLYREIKSKAPEIKVAGIYMHREPADSGQSMFDKIDYAGNYNNDAKVILNCYKPKVVLLMAHRFFDYMFAVEAHRQNILVFNFQHALYENTKIISDSRTNNRLSALSGKWKHIQLWIESIPYIININQKKWRDVWKTNQLLLKRYGLCRVMNERFGPCCNADVSLIYGAYWEKHYKEEYLENNSEFEVIGYPELENETIEVDRNVFRDPRLPIVCYLAQISVENGTVSDKEFNDFMNAVRGEIGKINLIIKFHPRSDRAKYDLILDNEFSGNVFVWEDSKFPIADAYIGHESTVVARALYITEKVLVCRWNEKRISQYESFSEFVCTSSKDFGKKLEEMLLCPPKNVRNEKLEQYAYLNQEGALKSAADIIIKHIFDVPVGAQPENGTGE